MIRHLGRLWIAACIASLALAPAALAQDMTGAVVTDPPAPVADGYATFTGTYENLGPGPAADIYVNVLRSDPAGDLAAGVGRLQRDVRFDVGTDTNGNDRVLGLRLGVGCATTTSCSCRSPTPTGDQSMTPNPVPAGASGSFSWQMPVIPMEGVNAGRLVITEPERLRNSYGVNSANWTTYPWLWAYAGLLNLVGLAASAITAPMPACPTIEDCADLSVHWSSPVAGRAVRGRPSCRR